MSNGSRPSFLNRWFAPWSQWQDRDSAGTSPLQRGIEEYHRRGAATARPTYRGLVESHQPAAIFLTCSDARIVPHQLTGSGPGDLFMIRNVGNLVPRADDPDASVAGALEYAIDVVGIPELMVCGHSGCGAMRALSGHLQGEHPALERWLAAAQPTVDRWSEAAPGSDSDSDTGGDSGSDLDSDPVDRLGMLNVVQQLDNAMTLPFLRQAVESGRLRMSAAFFDVASATVAMYDPEAGAFQAVDPARSVPLTG